LFTGRGLNEKVIRDNLRSIINLRANDIDHVKQPSAILNRASKFKNAKYAILIARRWSDKGPEIFKK
jgi:hypothetical protein